MISFPVHELLTFKSGKFIFSINYSDDNLLPYFIESEILYQTINDLPILPRISSQIEEELIKRSIFSTAALEGNPLSENKVIEILNETDKNYGTKRAKKEIQNLKQAYAYLKAVNIDGNYLVLKEELLRSIHKSITQNIDYKDNIPGNFRNHKVKVGDNEHGGIYTPPKIIEDISMLSNIFFEWINNERLVKLNPIVRAAIAHYHLALIHPFADGNGRTARIVEALILQTSGLKYVPIMLSNYYYRNMDDYYWAFSKTIRNKNNDLTGFLEFVLVGLIESLKEIKEKITYQIRVLTLKDYYLFLRSEKEITRRQYDLLLILIANSDVTFSFKDLNQAPPFNLIFRNISPSTIRRDLANLLDLKLIKNVKEQLYQLNIRLELQ